MTTPMPYLNRELSLLAFTQRVLGQANNERHPLLERVKYLSFVGLSLDEFFEIRVAGLLEQLDHSVSVVSPDGMTVQQQLSAIHTLSQTLILDQYTCWNKSLMPKLKEAGIVFKNREAFSAKEHQWLKTYFDEQVYPVLTPIAIDPAHPFPQLLSKGLNILVGLEDAKDTQLAIIPVPRILPRIVQLGSSGPNHYCFLSDVIGLFAHTLFPGYAIQGTWDFRITRNSDLYVDEEESDNLLVSIEQELHKIRQSAPVRLEIRKGVPEALLSQLLELAHFQTPFVFKVPGPVNLQRIQGIYSLIDDPKLKFPAYAPRIPEAFDAAHTIFETLRKGDHLLHHPYESFESITRFIQAAAEDPNVLAIKQTLYRTSGDSPIIEALKTACLNSKQVTVLIELKACFDEARNIQWARQLEDAGAHVVYGLVGLKTHCKCALVIRSEGGTLRHYAHLGTGNYHPTTAQTYTDLSLLTAQPAITQEVAYLFNILTGHAKETHFEHLLVAPFNLYTRLKSYIEAETQHARQGLPARIIAKVNSLVDPDIIQLLYTASQSGVQIDLIVRGICCLVPGLKGISDHIRVHSLLGRYLEHSRIFYFQNATGEPKIYLGSADWMPRNFHRRIETLFPVYAPLLRERILESILPTYLKDTLNTHKLGTDGIYHSLEHQLPAFSAQEHFSSL